MVFNEAGKRRAVGGGRATHLTWAAAPLRHRTDVRQSRKHQTHDEDKKYTRSIFFVCCFCLAERWRSKHFKRVAIWIMPSSMSFPSCVFFIEYFFSVVLCCSVFSNIEGWIGCWLDVRAKCDLNMESTSYLIEGGEIIRFFIFYACDDTVR